MTKPPVCAVLDIGKTNKKLLLFDEQYRVVYERETTLPEITDEDGDPCEDLAGLNAWIDERVADAFRHPDYVVRAINVAAYGASLVGIGADGQPVTPLYNYLKPFPDALRAQFYAQYGGEAAFSVETASPVLGHLNSGMQLYRLRHQRPNLFGKIRYALHLPQYVAYRLTGRAVADLTSLGCHTNLWSFARNDYHPWVRAEGVLDKMAPIVPSDNVVEQSRNGRNVVIGVGLHDSSAALIPYLAGNWVAQAEPGRNRVDSPLRCEPGNDGAGAPFVLLSTGTWIISLNPFNTRPLTAEELAHDCLCYLTYRGTPVKAARLFAGHAHEQQVARLAAHFRVAPGHYKTVRFNASVVERLRAERNESDFSRVKPPPMTEPLFGHRALSAFSTYEEAYHQLMLDIVGQQLISTELVLAGARVQHLYVDGGFGRNPVFMHLLARAFPDLRVSAASVAQASAMGAALAIHRHWNTQPLPTNLVALTPYKALPATT